MRKCAFSLMVVFVAVSLLAVGSQPAALGPAPAAAQAKTVVLKTSSSFPEASLLTVGLKMFADSANTMSGGRLKFDVLPAGSVVGAFEVVDAVNRGLLDAAYTCTYYYVGKHMAAALFTDVPGGPFGMDTLDFWGWEYEGGGVELLNEFYQKVLRMDIVAIPLFPTHAQSLGWFKKPIKSLDDLKGLKYRVPGLAAEVYKDIGMSVVTLPGGELLPAGERGVLDATEWYTPAEDIRLGFYSVWKYYHYPSAHETAGACDLLINKTVWDKLSPDLQEMIRAATFKSAFRILLKFNHEDAVALEQFKGKGVTLVRTPDEIIAAQLKAWDKIAKREAAKDPFFKKVLASQRSYAAKVVPKRQFMNPYGVIAKYYWGEPME